MNDSKQTMSLAARALLGGAMMAGCAVVPVTSEGNVEETSQALRADCPAGVPAALTPASDQTIKAQLTGIGVQIYICNATASGFGWTFVAPQANLLNDEGKLAGTHFIGPTWQANDGSSVVGLKVAGVTVEPTALPWLLLTASSHVGDGRFSDVTSIQRLATVGGLAPVSPCDATHLGTIAQVPYSAEYVLYKMATHGRIKQCGGL